MFQQKLSSLELMYLAAKCGAKKIFGVPDHFSLLEPEEKTTVRQEIIASLLDKEAIRMDLDGKLSVSPNATELITICTDCELMLSFNHSSCEGQQIEIAIWKHGDVFLLADIANDLYSFHHTDLDGITALFDEVNLHDSPMSQDGSTAIPQIALTKVQRYVTKHNTDAAVQFLRQYGAEEQMAERITAMLAEQVDIYALMLCMPDIPARRLAFLSDSTGCIKMGGTVENFKSCVEFSCVSAADIRSELQEIQSCISQSVSAESKTSIFGKLFGGRR